MNEMKDRIKTIRKHFDLTQQEFADKIGVKRNTIATYESGRNQPIDAVIGLICREFKISEDWLRTGDGEMLLKLNKRDELLLWASQALSNESEDFVTRFINVLSELDVNDWELLANTAETLAKQKKKGQ